MLGTRYSDRKTIQHLHFCSVQCLVCISSIHPWCAMLAIFMIFIVHCTLSTVYYLCLLRSGCCPPPHSDRFYNCKCWVLTTDTLLWCDRRAWTTFKQPNRELYAQTSANQWVNSCTESKLLFLVFFFLLFLSIRSVICYYFM